MMRRILLTILLLASIQGAFAHTEQAEDAPDDLNQTHFDEPINETYSSTVQYTAQKEVSSWEDAWPYVLLLFLGLGGFAFAMGLFLHPNDTRKRKR
jgi:hypothetical protein